MSVVGSIGGNKHEPFALLVGVISILTSVLFFLNRYDIFMLKWRVDDEVYLLFFAGMALISGIIMLLTTIGLLGTGS